MLTRRSLLLGSVSSALAAACRTPQRGPAISVQRPLVTHGLQVGEVQDGKAIVWARCSEPARMVVEWSTSERGPWRAVAGPVVTSATDHAGVVALNGLPGAQRIVYRVRFDREAARGASEAITGTFVTPNPNKLRVVWTGDTCGQGYGRNPEWGGLRGYTALRAAQPDVFLHAGDMIYADNPIKPQIDLPDGRIWRNVTNERVSRVAQELDDFRARFSYNLDDENVRALVADTSVVVQWDDHETHNNWWPGQILEDERYQLRDASRLAARARQAFFEWNPLAPGPMHRVLHHGPLLDIVVLDVRAFRGPNDAGLAERSAMLGTAQTAWLVETLASSRARFKLVACDQPLALVIRDRDRFEGFANGVDGPPLGRERELADLFVRLHERGVKNFVFVTADVHYAAAHHYDPQRAGFPFHPFWEFVAGPIHAGTFGPELLDPSLGGEVRFQWAPPPGMGNLAPWDGLQTYGTVDVASDALRVGLWGIDGKRRFDVELPYEA
jgi:alkaline phosphatase D